MDIASTAIVHPRALLGLKKESEKRFHCSLGYLLDYSGACKRYGDAYGSAGEVRAGWVA